MGQLGLGKERVIGIYLERSVDVIVALLAVFRSGSIALPLDPASPEDRLQFMANDAQVSLVLAKAGMPCPIQNVRVLPVDVPAVRTKTRRLRQSVSADDAAYIIYTSGSTGKPKGVVVTHGALARHCLDTAEAYEVRADDRVLQFNSITFDAAFEQIFTTLIRGATLILRGPEVWTCQEFTACLDKHRLTVVDLPTAYWHQLLQDWHSNRCRLPQHLPRLMIVGGEAMLPHSLRLWSTLPFAQVRLLNAYGPTETTITASTYDVQRELLEGDYSAACSNWPPPRATSVPRPRSRGPPGSDRCPWRTPHRRALARPRLLEPA